jgi:TrbL/VirB6 plasmid conjugal transfer protein
MGGSTTMQFLWTAYNTNLAQAVVNTATLILGGLAVTMQGVLGLYIIIIGKQLMFNELGAGPGVTKMVRAIVIMSLMSAANFQTFVATPITTTVPNFINNILTGSQGLVGAQGWDALINKVDNYSNQVLGQAVGVEYLADRVTIWAIGVTAKIVIACCYFIYSLSTAAADILVPVIAILLPFYLFDVTRQYVERAAGKVVALFLVMIITLMLGQIVVYQDGQYLQKYSANIAAEPPAQGFNFMPDNDNLGLLPTTPGAVPGATINPNSAIGTFGNALVVMIYGLFLMAISTGIALYIGGASGFSTAPMTRAIQAGVSLAVRAASGGK